MGVGVPGTEGWATGLSHTHCLFPGPQAIGLRLRRCLCQSQSAARGQQGEGKPQAPTAALWWNTQPGAPTWLCLAPPHPARPRSQLLGCANSGGSYQGGRVGGYRTVLALGGPDPPCLGPRPASFGHAPFRARGYLSGRRHSPITASPARMLSARPLGEDLAWATWGWSRGMGLAWPGLTWAATRLCVCEDPWLQRQRQAPSLGELRVPLRKLVPNRARSFDICLEKRRLVSGAGAQSGTAEARNLVMGGAGGEEQGGGSGQHLARMTGLSALSGQEAQEPGHSLRHVPL